ncbi:MAG TPA: hypothetical protein VGC30_06545, partial [Dokdonella sp.]
MPKPAVTRRSSLYAAFRHFLPAWLLFAATALVDHPLSLVVLLIADAIAMTAVCRLVGFEMEATFLRSVARRGLAYFVLLTLYTAFVAVLLVGPTWWLSRDGALPAALLLSGALAVAVLALWRVWPAFALPFVWDDAYPRDDERGSWLTSALRRSLAFAAHLTREHDLFFGYGLPAGFALLLLATGALALAGIGDVLVGDVRPIALAAYALLVVPAAHLVLARRCLRALLADARAARRAAADAAVAEKAAQETAAALPPGIGRAELDATLLNAARSAQTSLALAALERGADPNVRPESGQRDQRSA